MKFKFLILFIMFFSDSFGQMNLNQEVKTLGESIKDFVPENWKVLQLKKGDLNKDKVEDIAVVIQSTDSSKIEILKNEEESSFDTIDTNNRILLVLIKDNKSNKYILKGKSNSFIINRNSSKQSDPFQGIDINNNTLIINFFLWYSVGSWYQTDLKYIFRYQNDKMKLIGAEYNDIHRGTSEGIQRSFNFNTKKMSETKCELDKNGELVFSKTLWKKLSIKELKTIETLTQPLNWMPIDGIQL